MRKVTLLAAGLILLLAGYAYAADQMPEGVQARKADSGKVVLVDSMGYTLYTFGEDEEGKSNCDGGCAVTWPPLFASADAKAMGDWTVVTRDDGSKQWAYRGKALYTYDKDLKPGDTTGDGVSRWYVATP